MLDGSALGATSGVSVKYKGRLMQSPTPTRGLLGIFPQGADLTANNPRATTPPVRSLTYSSLWAISAAGARGRSARGGVSGRRGPWEEGMSGEGGEAESEGWSGRANDSLKIGRASLYLLMTR